MRHGNWSDEELVANGVTRSDPTYEAWKSCKSSEDGMGSFLCSDPTYEAWKSI